jgi:hypothetical protein
MASLADRIRRQRESRLQVGRFTFIVRRPTQLEMDEIKGTLIAGSNRAKARALFPFIAGWEGVTEGDLINGGPAQPVPFDPEACAEWLEDATDVLPAVLNGIAEAFTSYQAKREADEKN